MDDLDQKIIKKQAEILKLSEEAKAIQPLFDHTKAEDDSATPSEQIEISIIRLRENIAEVEYELLLEQKYPGTASLSAEAAQKKIEDLKLEITEAEVDLTKL